MATDSLDRFERLFRAALMHPPDERQAFLDASCADDPELRRELESLLEADRRADDEAFLDEPVLPWTDAGLGPGSEEETERRSAGPYTILRSLGHGGMGDVYLAVRERPFKRYVALKIIRRGMDTREVLLRFEMERQILASLNHPHVARLIDGGMTDDGLPYFAMEYVEGLPLTEYCDVHRLRIEERLRLFQTVCRAVQYAHRNLIIHRDLKPSNIFVTKEGTVKLLDFGIAKLLNPNLSPHPVPVTRADLRRMTPEYASPEQVRGETLTTASDVYALGVILYELLTGHRPYHVHRRTTAEIAQVVCEQEPERPSTKVARTETVAGPAGTTTVLTPDAIGDARGATPDRLRRLLRGDLDNIVLMAMRKEPGRRYGSAEQLEQDIERYLTARPVVARQPTLVYQLRKFAVRNRGSVTAVLLVVLSLVGGLGAALWQGRQTRYERDRAEQALRQSEEVTNFLMGLFSANDPDEAQGDTVTARELLERGVAHAGELEGQPAVQARMLDVTGRVYMSLGLYDRARPLLERALRLRREQFGEEHPDVAESLDHVGHLLRRRNDYEEAERYHRQALALRRRLLGERHPDLAKSMHGLALAMWDTGKREESLALLRQTLALQQEVPGERDLDVAATLRSLGGRLRLSRRLEAAADTLHLALAMQRRLLGDDNLTVASTLHALGQLHIATQRYDESERYFREALQIRQRVLDERHPSVADSYISLGLMMHQKGDLDAALEYHRRALDIYRERLGNTHRMTAIALERISLAFRAKGDYAAAEAATREALAVRERVWGPGHGLVAGTVSTLADLVHLQGRLDEAAALYREAIAMNRAAYEDVQPALAFLLSNYAGVLLEQGDPGAAEPPLLESVEILVSTYGNAHPWLKTSYERLVATYDALGRRVDADRYRALLHE